MTDDGWRHREELIESLTRPIGGDPLAMRAAVALRTAEVTVFGDIFTRLRQESDLGPNPFTLLMLLLAHGEIDQGTLAGLAPISKGAVSTVVQQLVSTGHVARREKPDDRRAVLLRVTEDGERLARDAFAVVHAREVAWMSRLDTAEQEDLVRLLSKLIESPPD